MKLESLVQYLDEYLRVQGHPDYPTAVNGLQVAGPTDVEKVVVAVDASEATILEAVRRDADLLLVHHGLFWEGLQPITGRTLRRLRPLLEAEVALYACHLPLDSHPEVGNCALLGGALGLTPAGRFAPYQGVEIGWIGTYPDPVDPAGLRAAAATAVGGPVRWLEGGPPRIERVGVLTGSGASAAKEAARLGLHALVTGEASHHTYFDALEYGLHILLAGHYATETFGVRAVGDHLAERFGLTSAFLDQPTGL